jgi:hypothetical protein
MRNATFKLIFIIALLLAFVSGAHATIDPLYIGVGARPLGMGKAYVAVAEDGDTVFVNPAGLGRIDGPKVTSMYSELMGDIRYVVIGGVYPYLPVGSLGGGIVSASTADIMLYDGGGNPLGKADYGNNVFFLSYGLKLSEVTDFGDDIAVGASLKYFSQSGSGDINLDEGTGTGFDADLGVLYTPTPWLSFGYTQTNLLPTKISFTSGGQEEDVVSLAKLGGKVEVIGKNGLVKYKALQGSGYQKLNLALDYDLSTDDPVGGAGHIGLEYYPVKYLALRVGLDQDPGADEIVSNLTAGVGLRYDGLEFNYAYHPYDGVMDNTTHFFSISYVGPEEEEPEPVVEVGDMKLELLKPRDKTITRDSTLDISLRIVNIKPGTTVAINGKEVELDESGELNTTMRLRGYGKKLVKATATDDEGNVLEEKARVLRLMSFRDVSDNYWARPPIEHSGTVGLTEGYPDSTFKPERALTRAELATLLVRARGIELPDVPSRPFPDVSKSHWATRYIAAAEQMGLIQGYPDGTFRPNNKINRAEGVLVLSRFEGLMDSYTNQAPYSDVPSRHWAASMVSAAKEAEFLDYIKSDYFRPRQAFPRSEAVYILSKSTYAKDRIDWLLDWEVGFEDTDEGEFASGPEMESFKDIPDGHWASKPIRALATAGILSGYPDGTFRPNRTLSRAELSTLLVKAKGMDLPVLRSGMFKDVAKAHWAALYIQAAVDLDLVQGYPTGVFKPNKSVSRAEAITVIDRFDGIEVPNRLSYRPFPDVPVNHWSARFVAGGKDAGILDYLSGYKFEPSRGLTRAEAAEMISKTTFGKASIEKLYPGSGSEEEEFESDEELSYLDGSGDEIVID